MSATDIRARTRTYELLLVMQTLAVLIILWSMLPLYHAIMEHPGYQIRVLPESPVPLVAAVILFHCVYWFRLLRVRSRCSGTTCSPATSCCSSDV
jgi:hypothetical protein